MTKPSARWRGRVLALIFPVLLALMTPRDSVSQEVAPPPPEVPLKREGPPKRIRPPVKEAPKKSETPSQKEPESQKKPEAPEDPDDQTLPGAFFHHLSSIFSDDNPVWRSKLNENGEASWYNAHGQATLVTQAHDNFRASYAGGNSLPRMEPAATSFVGTVFLSARLFQTESDTTDLIFNPENAGGTGLGRTTGIAGFPNGDITRVGLPTPTWYIARLLLKQTIGLGGRKEEVPDGPTQIATTRDVNRLTVTLGRMASTDLVDDNRIAHDSHSQFLNWAMLYNGAWDYPADVRGYTTGMGLDLNQENWALRYGIYQEPAVANGAALDGHFNKAFGQVIELEERYFFLDHPGKARFLAFLNRAHMGSYLESLAAMPVTPDITQTRAYRYKYGFGANIEQEVSQNVSFMSRVGWNDGHTESWAYTEIDNTIALGLRWDGKIWSRPDDEIGLAVTSNGVSAPHRHYLAAGGLGFIIGDGKLRYGREDAFEIYYNLAIRKGLNFSLDFQEIGNPAYNRDRGPVSVVAMRLHFEF